MPSVTPPPSFIALAICACLVPVTAMAAPISIQFEVQLRATKAALEAVGVPGLLAGTAASAAIHVGDITERADVDAAKYSAQSGFVPGGTIGPFIKSAGFARASQGTVQAGMQQTTAFQDARAGKSRVITRPDAGGKTASAMEGAKVHEKVPLRGPLVDMLGLQYAYAGRPDSIKPFSATLATGKGFVAANFGVQRETIAVAGESVMAIRLYRLVAAGNGGFEVWFRASDGVPLMNRISLSAKYGATLTATAKKMPPAFKW